MATIAPELPGGLAAVAQLREAGVVVAVGHTEATYAQTRDAIAAGATVGTHLFNAMRPIKHREPGPVVALAEAPGVVLELITDGVHLHPAMYEQVRRWVGPSRIALVTDAMAAAGMSDGSYALGSLDVTVADGCARVTGTDTIAGGTATTDQLFRVALGWVDGLASDEALLAAVAQTSGVPLRALELSPRDLSPGTPADIVVLTSDLVVERVIKGGQLVGAMPRT
jgi:N-acetylglucosamine-6-phosphate deacetylase